MADASAAKPLSFRDLMALCPLSPSSDPDTYYSTTPVWPPGSGIRGYGGHVYAQAAYAASKTVPRGMQLHNITGHFVNPVLISVPLIYRVRRVRDGGIYCIRSVDAFQIKPDGNGSAPPPSISAYFDEPTRAFREWYSLRKLDPPKGGLTGTETPCFVAMMSFKHPEENSTDASVGRDRPSGKSSPEKQETNRQRYISYAHQPLPPTYLRTHYASVLPPGNGPNREHDPSMHPLSPSADAPWQGRVEAGSAWSAALKVFPGVEMRKVDMSAYNGAVYAGGSVRTRGVGDGGVQGWRQLTFYRIILPDHSENDQLDEEEELGLDVSAHLYASDRNSLFVIQRGLGYEERICPMASLSHTVVFYGDAERLRFRRRSATSPPSTSRSTLPPPSEDRLKWFVQEAWTSVSGANRGCHESRLWDWETGEVVGMTLQDGMMRIPALDGEAVVERESAGKL